MTKPRILFCGEATYTNSGYATYQNEVMRRMHATGKYELAELASYGDASDPGDQRWRQIPWKFYPVKPNRNSSEETREYDSNSMNQFGSWKFERACCDFHPDIVVDIRDWWMLEFEQRSPFRNNYHWAIMPTVDSIPQDEQWLATYADADAVFTYTDWGLNVLKSSSGPHINTKCAAPPAADMSVFYPAPNRREHRSKMDFDPDAYIIGTVMRNQSRKLYPELIEAFAEYLERAPERLAKKTFLYLHTSWPDLGWDIPRLIKDAGVSHKCVFTYCCSTCGSVYPAFFSDSVSHCIHCGEYTARFPTSNRGISREVLANILNMFDVYVQYATNEGFGMPMVEAAACGVPVMAVDYSAMEDVVRKVNGFPIRVLGYGRDSSTGGTRRAVPDNGDFVDKLIEHLGSPSPVRSRRARAAREGVEANYSYDKTAQIWMDHFDGLTLPAHETTWLSPGNFHKPNLNIPQGLNEEEFVKWGMTHVAGRPDLVNSYTGLRMIRDLSWGRAITHMGGLFLNEMSNFGLQDRVETFNRENAVQRMVDLCEMKNHFERMRVSSLRS